MSELVNNVNGSISDTVKAFSRMNESVADLVDEYQRVSQLHKQLVNGYELLTRELDRLRQQKRRGLGFLVHWLNEVGLDAMRSAGGVSTRRAKWVYGQHIDVDKQKGGKLDSNRLSRHISETVPVDFDGIIGLDWEGQIIRNLRNEDTRADAIGQIVQAIDIVQELRPDALVGWYDSGVTSRFSNHNDGWRRFVDDCSPIWATSSVLLPRVMDLYRDDEINTDYEERHDRPHDGDYDIQYVFSVVEMNLRIARGIPVVPVISPRHPISKKNPDGSYKRRFSGHVIGAVEFSDHILAALAARWYGSAVHGVAVWMPDRQKLEQNKVIKGETNEPIEDEGVARQFVDAYEMQTYKRLSILLGGANYEDTNDGEAE